MGLTDCIEPRSGSGGLGTCSEGGSGGCEGGSGGCEGVGVGFTEEDRDVAASDQLDTAELT